jgi:hypothetical protein
LIDGKVEITPTSDNLIEPIKFIKATHDSGVSVAEMSMIARGKIVKDAAGGIALEVQPSQIFRIEPNGVSQQLDQFAGSSKLVTLQGLLYKKAAHQKKETQPTSLTLTVLEIQQTE